MLLLFREGYKRTLRKAPTRNKSPHCAQRCRQRLVSVYGNMWILRHMKHIIGSLFPRDVLVFTPLPSPTINTFRGAQTSHDDWGYARRPDIYVGMRLAWHTGNPCVETTLVGAPSAFVKRANARGRATHVRTCAAVYHGAMGQHGLAIDNRSAHCRVGLVPQLSSR